jgi:hypothetical protein
MLHRRAPVFPRLAPAATFVGFALAAGILQILATIVLGLASVDALHTAADERSGWYVVGALGTGGAMLGLWFLRERPLVGSVLFFVWELTLVLTLAPRTSAVGLAFHGEYILHHFATLLGAAACFSTAIDWWRRDDLGNERLLAVGTIACSTFLLLLVHVLSQPGIAVRLPRAITDGATALAILAPIIALGVLWKSAGPAPLRLVSIALLLPVALRVGFALPEGLSGGSVPDDYQQIVMVSIVASAAFTFWAFRPEMPRPVRILVIALSALATTLLYLIYRRGFGDLEDGIGGLAQSLFGFALPYPTYVPGWKIVVVTVALFFVFATVYGGLMSWNERVRGLALGLLAITGIGLSNPQLVLMLVAGHLLWIDTLVDRKQSEPAAPALPIEDLLSRAAELLGVPAPIVLEAAEGAVVSVRGEVEGTTIDVRARPLPAGRWVLVVRTGVMGRGRPDVELAPDPGEGGQRPTHAIGRTHRVRGQLRALEAVGDGALDALLPFVDAHARFWAAGVEVELGRDLSRLDAAVLHQLVRALSMRP